MSVGAGWVTIRIVPGARAAEVSAALFGAGASSIQELGDSLITHVESQTLADVLVAATLAANPDALIETTPLPITDWSAEWRRGIRAHTVGALTITPPWLTGELDPAATIVIDPAMAFGTGEHATTRGVIRLLQAVLRPGDRVADLGAGSAVVAIAAAKLGAASVAAIEIDHDAIENAESNVARNGVADRVRVIEGDAATLLPLVAPVRIITANIISSVLVDLLPVIDLAITDDGRAILAGIMLSEREHMIAEITSWGWQVEADDVEEKWWSATIARP